MNLLLNTVGSHLWTETEVTKMKVTRFPAGKERQVHVSRPAIIANLRDKKTFPTVIVHDEGKMYEFHQARVNGLLKFDAEANLEAKVFISTDEEIVCYTDPDADQTLMNLPVKSEEPKVTFWMRLKTAWASFWHGVGVVADNTPILACIRGADTWANGHRK